MKTCETRFLFPNHGHPTQHRLYRAEISKNLELYLAEVVNRTQKRVVVQTRNPASQRGIEVCMRPRLAAESVSLPVSACLVLAMLFGIVNPQPGPARSQTEAGQKQSGAAQPASEAPKSFEVASIEPSAGDGRMLQIGISPGGRWTAMGVSAKMLIEQAYDVRDFQISGGPGWLSSERYDIVAKAETPNIGREQMKVLLQSLLADRFKLQLHRETRELPIYALVVGKGGGETSRI